MNHSYPAVVLDLSANGIGIIRSLARKGIDVYAFDTEKPYRIGKSRLATCGICPSPLTEEQELLAFLLNLGKGFKQKAVLCTGADDYVVFVSKYREELSASYVFLLPEHELIEAVLDKYTMYELAIKHNIPCPTTYIIKEREQVENAIQEGIEFPCILKPTLGHEFRKKINKKAIVINTPDELREGYEAYHQYGTLILQEIIPGDNKCFCKVATLYDDNMELLALFSLQKNHQFPAEFGTGAHIVSKKLPDLIDMTLPFFKELNLKGIGMVEWKKDPRDGIYKFIEINPRFWLTHSLTGASGVDFAYLYYLYVTNQNPAPQLEQIDDVKWIYLVRYYLTFRHKKRQGEMTWKDFFTGLRGKKEFALLARDDFMPFVRSTWSHLKNAWRRKRKE
jgi:D-aspartate ligase